MTFDPNAIIVGTNPDGSKKYSQTALIEQLGNAKAVLDQHDTAIAQTQGSIAQQVSSATVRTYASAPPASGAYTDGQQIYNSNRAAGQPIYWEYVAATAVWLSGPVYGASAAVPSTPASPPPSTSFTRSADGTTVPSATSITDTSGNVWTLGADNGPQGKLIQLNGVDQQGTAATILLIYNAVIYQGNASGSWWQWINSAWESVPSGDPRVTTTTSSGSAGSAPVTGYNTVALFHDFGTSKTGADAITNTTTLWTKFRKNQWYTTPVQDSQISFGSDYMGLSMVSSGSGILSPYIESNFVFDVTKNYFIQVRLMFTAVGNVDQGAWLYANSGDVVAGTNGGETSQLELDLVENFYPNEGCTRGTVVSTGHLAPNHGNLFQDRVETTDLTQNWHNFEIIFKPGKAQFFLDGIAIGAEHDYDWTGATHANAPPALILNVETLANFGLGGSPDPSLLPATLKIAYIKAWTNP